MKIRFSDSFNYKLENQIRYIAKDKPLAARNFKRDLLSRIRETKKMPFSYRKSIFSDNDDVRDLIFKGYCITFKITKDNILVFGFNKHEGLSS